MARKDFIISFFAGSPQLRAALSQLEEPYLLFEPQVSGRKYKDYVTSANNSILGLWNKARSASDELGRVAVMGFSEGAQGVRACLETLDASAIDSVFACDGIHTQMVGPALEMSRLTPLIAFGRMAIAAPPSQSPGVKLLSITHSAIGAASLPAGTASTTQTAQVIWDQLLMGAPAGVETPLCGWPCPSAVALSSLGQIVWPSAMSPVGSKVGGGIITPQGWTTVRPSAPETNFLPSATFAWSGFADGWTVRNAANNVYVFGWSYPTKNATKDPTGNRDHVFQAQMVLPNVTRHLLLQRWNPSCQPVSGYGDTSSCQMGGKGYYDQEQRPLDMGLPIPKLVTSCPPPPAGRYIMGDESDPCRLNPLPGPIEPGPGPEAESDWESVIKAGAVVAGGVGGWYGCRWLKRRFKH
jgi:hypothetical protein